MYRLIVLIVAFNLSAAYAITPAVEIDPVNGRAETIRNLDINGSLYNVSFDHAFGSDAFEGDAVGANAAIDAIVSILNTGYNNVDNSHPPQVAVFVVTFEDVTNSGYAACRSIYIPECDDGGWANVGDLNTYFEDISASARAYFEPVKQVAIDVLPGDETNFYRTDGNFSDKMVVDVLGSAEFDASQVDSAMVKLGPAEASPHTIPGEVRDGNHDGIDDMRLKFRIADVGLACDMDEDITLTGETNGGLIQFAGSDNIQTQQCDTAGCHP